MIYNRIKITKNRILWQKRLYTSKNVLMFVYGFAVPIDWETHQFLTKNRVSFTLSNGGPRLRVALESRWITKDRSPQILYSRSFVVLFCAAKLFYFLLRNMQSPSATADGLWYCKEFDWLTCTVGGSPANYRGSIFLIPA